MTKRLSTKLHTILLISVCGILVLLFTIVSLVNTVSDVGVINEEVAELEIILLNMRRNKDDFINRPNMSVVATFKENERRFKRLYDVLAATNHVDDVLSDSARIDLLNWLNKYTAHFDDYVDLSVEIGISEKSGLMGKMRSTAHQIDKELSRNGEIKRKNSYLKLRRNEKDFLHRGNDIYLENHKQLSEMFQQDLQSDTALFVLAVRYDSLFNKIVTLKLEQGVTKNFGVWNEMRLSADYLEAKLAEYISSVSGIVLVKFKILRTVSALIVLSAIGMIIVSILSSTRTIEKSFSHFYESFQHAKDTDMLIEQREMDYYEFNKLAFFANEMISERRKVHEMERELNSDLEQRIDSAVEEIEKLDQEIIATQREVIFTMGAIGESRSKETGNHVRRVAEYSRLLAEKLNLSEREVIMIKEASPMHDIGKVAIPDHILKKPGKLTFEEFEVMKTHAELGYEMLKHSNRPLLKTAAIIANEHHEKWNGSGYPHGTSGEDIHIYGRITALADVFDALGSDRVYKKAWPDEKIFQLLRDERGEHFDPRLIDIFFDNLDEFFSIRETFKDV